MTVFVVANGDTLYEMVSKLQNQIDDLSDSGESEAKKVNRIIAAVDLNDDGSYKIISGNYVGDATSIADAISKLDAAINTVGGSSIEEAKEYTDAKITESIEALDSEASAGDGEVFVKITEADGLVSGEVKALSVEKDATGLKYDLKLGNYVFGSVDIPQDQFLNEVIFISAATVEDIAEALNYGQSIELGKPYLKFVWKLEEGLKPTYVDVSGLIDVYTAADVKLSDAYSGTSFDIKSGGTLEDAVGKITKELTSIEENITANEIASSGKTILVQSSETGTNIDINIDGDTIVTDKTVAGEGKISVKLEVEKKYIDSGYVRTQYILKSSGSTYGVINDTRDVVVGDGDEYIKVATEQVSDVEGNRTDKLKITPTIQKNINNATSESVDDGNGLVTAWGVKSYIRDGMDGDGIMVGDDILQPHDKYYGAINFDGQSLTYDTVHEGFYKIDNNANRLAESIGFDFGHQESGITPNEILAYPGNNNAEAVKKTHFSAATNIMEALISLDDNQPFEWGKGEKAIQSVGTACSATGDYSFAVGYETLASGNKSHAEGYSTEANGDYSHAEGLGTITNNEAEHASGKYNNSTEGDQIFSIGIGSGDDDRKNAIEVHSDGTIFGEAILTTSGDVMSVTSTGKLADALTIKTLVDNMDYTADTEENKVFTGITQTNGHVAVTSENLTSRKLAGYQVVAVTNPSDESAKVATTDTLGQGLGKLQGQINAMDKATQAEENSVIYDVTERDGKVSAVSKHIVDIKLSGYTEGATTSGKISSGDTLGQALGKLQGQVNGLDYTADTGSDKVFTGITENDGKVSATTALITSRVITGYAEATDADVAETDTLGVALGKLQKQINSMDKAASSETGKFVRTVTEADGKVSETRGYIVADDVKITAATVNEANVKEAWKLVNKEGTQLGSTIKIYKDSSLKSVALSGDTSTSGQWLVFTYVLSDGSEDVVAVDVSKFLVQAEFQSGVTSNNAGIVHGVVSGDSESVVTAYTATGSANGTAKVLGVDGGGFYVKNIQTAINAKVNNAISLLDSSSATTNAGYYMTGITITNGKVTAIGQAQLTAQETELTTGNSTTATGNAVTGLSVSDHAITLNKKNFPEVAWKRVSAAGTNIDATTTAGTISIVTGNTGITLGGDAANKKITISHTDTSSQSSVDAGSGKFIKSVSVDTYGHVTGLTTGNTVDSATTAADSAKVAGKTVGNANGNVPLSNGTVNTNLNADMIDGKHVAVVSAIPSSPDANTIYILS